MASSDKGDDVAGAGPLPAYRARRDAGLLRPDPAQQPEGKASDDA